MVPVMDELVVMLDDPDAGVRCTALHALACDRCKKGSCGPVEEKVLPRAIALLAHDPDAHVRASRNRIGGALGPYQYCSRSGAVTNQEVRSKRCGSEEGRWLVPGGLKHE
jgi:hypothetical protein